MQGSLHWRIGEESPVRLPPTGTPTWVGIHLSGIHNMGVLNVGGGARAGECASGLVPRLPSHLTAPHVVARKPSWHLYFPNWSQEQGRWGRGPFLPVPKAPSSFYRGKVSAESNKPSPTNCPVPGRDPVGSSGIRICLVSGCDAETQWTVCTNDAQTSPCSSATGRMQKPLCARFTEP